MVELLILAPSPLFLVEGECPSEMLRSRVISAKFGPGSGQHEVLRGVSAMVSAQSRGLYEVLSMMISAMLKVNYNGLLWPLTQDLVCIVVTILDHGNAFVFGPG